MLQVVYTIYFRVIIFLEFLSVNKKINEKDDRKQSNFRHTLIFGKIDFGINKTMILLI